MKTVSLYDYPELYDSLRTPSPAVFQQVWEVICQHLGRQPHSVMDPACGPATWLGYFAERGVPVAGNDIEPGMVQAARKKCGAQAFEIIEGDMRDLKFQRGPFEVSFELSGTCGMLADEQNFRRFLRTVSDHTASGGLVMVTIFFPEPACEIPYVVDSWAAQVNGKGHARITYEVIDTHPSRFVDRVRRSVATDGLPQCPATLVDEYDMFSWHENHFAEVMADYPELLFSCSYAINNDVLHFTDPGHQRGETTVVFRRL
ncbi:MAG: class I SAM-dependent methyltransferase [Verrucomicrobiota bacterium]|nr:class I SAM-dependent methyltransferase [Verrucomicrobiota bacterium]